MSKEIEEMAKIMCQDAGTKNCNITCNAKPICDVNFYAERLYKEGYRKQSEGEWKWISDDDCICSACGRVFYSADNADAGTGLWKFCPNCGAKMRKEDEGK